VTRPELPPELRRFILTSIPSVPYLEALLLLRAEPTREWAVADVARRLYLPEARAAELLQAMAEAGITRPCPGGQCYGPDAALDEMLGQLATHYAADIVGVSDLIHSRVDKKAQQFADAFRWRKDS
jgi:DNA-binding IclR family transcriptional regulator